MKGFPMRLILLGILALAAMADVAPAHAQAARTTIVVTPRILTPDMPRFQRLSAEQAICIKMKKKAAKRSQLTPEQRDLCRTE
jgi:hypothetical protein